MHIFLGMPISRERFILRVLLERNGHTVDSAADGKAALQRLRHTRHRYLVLLDLRLPLVNGAQFLYIVAHEQRLRSRHRYALFIPAPWPFAPALDEVMQRVHVQLIPESLPDSQKCTLIAALSE